MQYIKKIIGLCLRIFYFALCSNWNLYPSKTTITVLKPGNARKKWSVHMWRKRNWQAIYFDGCSLRKRVFAEWNHCVGWKAQSKIRLCRSKRAKDSCEIFILSARIPSALYKILSRVQASSNQQRKKNLLFICPHFAATQSPHMEPGTPFT